MSVPHFPGQHLRVNGARLWCEQLGDGEPVVFVAGGPGAAHTYLHHQSSWTRLSDQFRLVFFDALGCGASDHAAHPDEYTLERAVDDLEGLRAALGFDSWHVVGHSYGGAPAQLYALAHPERTRSLVLANTFESGSALQEMVDLQNAALRNQYPENWERLSELRARGVRSRDPEHFKAVEPVAMLTFWFDASNSARTTWELNWDVFYAMTGSDADFEIGGPLARFDPTARLGELRAPTLVIAGRYDRALVPRRAVTLARRIAGAELAIFERSGHLPFIEEPEESLRVLRDFLTRAARSRSG